jgi:microcystin degradation protein MlrC
VLADIADNPGAGAPGDSTWLLHRLFEMGQRDVAVASLVDPAAVAACHDAGTGSRIPLAVGGKALPSSGLPIERSWTVRHLGEGVFANAGPIGRRSTTRLGRTATIESDGISIILCERRVQTLEPAMFGTGGIDPLAMQVLVVKSSVHYRAAFAPLASRMIDVETPGLCTSFLESLAWKHSVIPCDETIAHV